MNLSFVMLAFCGFAVVLWLLRENDYRAVLRIVAEAGGALVIVVLIRGTIIASCGLAWCFLLRSVAAVHVGVALRLRTVREAINVLLPVASVGGDMARARLLNFSGVASGVAVASISVDLLLEVTAQALFALLGVALLTQVDGGTEMASWATGGLGLAALAIGGFYAAQRFGGGLIIERALGALARRWRTTTPDSDIRLHESLQTIFADRFAIVISLSLHELAWLLGALETWVGLWLIGVPISPNKVIILESLTQALRGAAFPMPSALGVQEGGFTVLGALLGIPAEAALALSFVKRVPDLAIGLPGLLACYWLERRQLLLIPAGVQPPGPLLRRPASRANGSQTTSGLFTQQADDQHG